MDRITFLESISGIKYPNMIVEFFDHFIALKQIVESSGKVTVIHNSENAIAFSILFDSELSKSTALLNIQSGYIVIYGRTISINVEESSSTEITIELS